MKPIGLCLCLVVTITVLAFSQSAGIKADKNSKEEQVIIKLEREWNEASKKQDKAVLERILAEDYISNDDTGQPANKADVIATLHDYETGSYTLDNLTVKVYGDTAILVGRWTGTLMHKGKDIGGVYWFTDTFVKRHGRWWAIATQQTRIPKKDSQ